MPPELPGRTLFGLAGGLGGVLFGQLLGELLGGGDLFGLAGIARLGGGFALAGLDLLGAGRGRLEDTGRLAATVAQVIELGAADLAALQDLDAVEIGAQHREDALDALAVGNLANREALVEAVAGAGDDDALIGLQALFFAFTNLHPDLDGVAMGEIGVAGSRRQRVVLLFIELGNDIGHGSRPFVIFSMGRFAEPVFGVQPPGLGCTELCVLLASGRSGRSERAYRGDRRPSPVARG